ncbi:MAG: TldD/PmbA family protein [Candidatus Thorarchaeota archaeon]|nr:TldD/PmbA family protein [Candidatus Thorarchaeota archaeon]
MLEAGNLAVESARDIGASFADCRVEQTQVFQIEIVDGVPKNCQIAKIKGAGIRALIDGSWGFCPTSDLNPDSIRNVAESAVDLAISNKDRVSDIFDVEVGSWKDSAKTVTKIPLQSVSIEEKMSLLKELDKEAHSFDSRISSSKIRYEEAITELHIVNSLGTDIHLELSIPWLVVILTACDASSSQRGVARLGGSGGFEQIDYESARVTLNESATLALDKLDSISPKGGTYDIITDPDLTGVLAHEAFGHACEADNWVSDVTIFRGNLGKKLGSEVININDDPTIPGLRGSFDYDWEGTKTRPRELIKEGVLNELLHTLETSSRMNLECTGAARCQSFMFEPIPRMGNTFFKPGDWDFEELVEDTRSGMILCGIGGGYTMSSKGVYAFMSTHGYLIEDGERGHMLRGTTISGEHLTTLSKIDALCDDFRMNSGTCGKGEQHVPDMSGGPHMRICKMVVGGN